MTAALSPAALARIVSTHAVQGRFTVATEEMAFEEPRPHVRLVDVYSYAAHEDDRADLVERAIEWLSRELERAGHRVEREGGHGLTDARILGAGIPLVACRDLGPAYTPDLVLSPLDDPAAIAWQAEYEARWKEWDREHGVNEGAAELAHGIAQARAQTKSWWCEQRLGPVLREYDDDAMLGVRRSGR